ncbi:hypothetical protein HAHI6034_11110 [Hathewaya histolytica]|uniref:Uncharacterized protein n=1 Tax=Hathewaya histolytica TaxID=1498 RepID=A0A4U9RAD7_HATHI|nr:hypothetical protein [Hathewaya histolytica]VTQ88449.1 Uncharacterised protein [Hathewaya histolytica]
MFTVKLENKHEMYEFKRYLGERIDEKKEEIDALKLHAEELIDKRVDPEIVDAVNKTIARNIYDIRTERKLLGEVSKAIMAAVLDENE